MKLLFLSTPVGALGSGLGGGVELTIRNLAQEMIRRGHDVQVVAPVGSSLNQTPIITIAGNSKVAAQAQERSTPIYIPNNSVLANMWDYARTIQGDYDLLVNFAFDWLPFYLTPFFTTPIAHFISMGSLNDALDRMMVQVAERFPGTIGVYTQSQAATFPFASACRCLGSGIDLSLYKFQQHSGEIFAWLGRIAPEKALEDAAAAAQITGKTLRIFGKMQDQKYWQQILQDYPDAPLEYVGFLPTTKLQQELGQCQALLMTPRWVEAFGNVAIEALACGVPVIAYNRGGPAEIVRDGKNGFLVTPDSVTGLVEAMGRIKDIDRYYCRQQAEAEYSLEALGNRFLIWFQEIINRDSK